GRARIPAARVEERGNDTGDDGHDPRHPVLRHCPARQPPAPVPEPRRDGDLAARTGGLRQRAGLRRPSVRDGGHPHARGQHRLRRLPAALLDHPPGRLPPPAARQPRGQPPLLPPPPPPLPPPPPPRPHP